jgi:cytochrome c553
MRIILLLLLLPITAHALNVENAKRINKTCALCHGMYSQGTPGMMSPRLAGLPSGYIAKEMEYYRDGTREYAPMVVTSSIKSMTDEDIQDISDYLGDMDIRQMGLPDIPERAGDIEAGKKIFKRECKSCHGRKGHGKPHKDIPPVAGQYGSYLLNQINKFRIKDRYHDDDPEDDLFKEFSSACWPWPAWAFKPNLIPWGLESKPKRMTRASQAVSASLLPAKSSWNLNSRIFAASPG